MQPVRGNASKRVVFFAWPEPGHALPAISLAKALVAKGHAVRFVSWDTTLDLVRANGLIADDIFELSGLAEELKRWRAAGSWSETLLDREHEAVTRTLTKLQPDLLLLDPLFWRTTLRASRAGARCMHLSANLPDEFDPEILPWSSARQPGGQTPLHKLSRRLTWERARLAGWLKHRWGLPVESDMLDLSDARRLVRETEWPDRWCELRAFHKPALGVPELVMCPAAFEFPQKRQRPFRYYVESGIDHGRPEDDSGVQEIMADPRPLVLVSLGSQATRYADSQRLFELFAGVAARMPGNSFVVATAGSQLDTPLPANVKALKHMPQLTLLRRAAAMVTHGGLGTTKECIVSGVPMCVLPLKWDQPSVAARVVHHGLGLSLAAKTLSAPIWEGALRQLLTGSSFKLRCELMRREFDAVDSAAPGAALVDAVLHGAARPTPTKQLSAQEGLSA